MSKSDNNVVQLKRLLLKKFDIYLMGTSPLIMHAWSKKAIQSMLDKQMKKATTGRAVKDPQRDFEESIYTDRTGLPSFPSVAFKASAVDAAQAMDFKKTNLRQSFHIEGDMVPIVGSNPEAREDMVRVGMGAADIRYRAEFRQWATVLPVVINSSMLSAEQLINLFDAAGFGIGVGEWRPQRDGQFGRFKIASAEEEKVIQGWIKDRNKKARAA